MVLIGCASKIVKEFLSSTNLYREMQLEQERIEAEKKRVRKISR
jgi:hypothetical protein